MSRALYKWLVCLHPGSFRRQFGDEMLWVFEEASRESRLTDHKKRWSVLLLLADAGASLVRQWLRRSISWRIAAAMAGALIQVTIAALGLFIFGLGPTPGPLRPAKPAAPVELDGLIRLILWTVSGVCVMVILLATWLKKFSARRIRAHHL